ncbi:hypothetical protein LEMLEM_LOCUS4938, partial [Lemmus lemmus]
MPESCQSLLERHQTHLPGFHLPECCPLAPAPRLPVSSNCRTGRHYTSPEQPLPYKPVILLIEAPAKVHCVHHAVVSVQSHQQVRKPSRIFPFLCHFCKRFEPEGLTLTLNRTKKSCRPKEKVNKRLRLSPRTPDPFCDSDFLLVLLLSHKDNPWGWEGMHPRHVASTEQMGRSRLPPASSSVHAADKVSSAKGPEFTPRPLSKSP